MINKIITYSLTIILIFSLIACGGGGDSDDSSAGFTGDICDVSGNRVFQGTQCNSATNSIVELIFLDGSGQPMGLCTGAIIDTQAVLTAAHCFDLPGFESVSIISGGVSTAASRFVIHPRYNRNENLTPFDAAVLFASSPLPASPLAIRASRSPFDGEEIRIFGFGEDESGVSLFEQGIRGSGPKAGQSSIVYSEEGIFVAGNPSQGVCSGDSGGPAISANSEIVGIAQAGVFIQGCSDSILTLAEYEQVRGSPVSEAEFESIKAFSNDDGQTFAVNFYTDPTLPEVLNFITDNVPATSLR